MASRNIFLQTAFSYLTGNGDLHAKNYSVLQGLDGQWVMAPIYDVACTLVYGDNEMALSVAGRKKGIRLNHWLEFAEAIGLPEKAAKTALKKALVAAKQVSLEEIGFTGSTLASARRTLNRRHEETEKDMLRG